MGRTIGGTPMDGGRTSVDGESHRAGGTQWKGWESPMDGNPMDGRGGEGMEGMDSPSEDLIDGETSGESGAPMKGRDPMHGSPIERWGRGGTERMVTLNG